MCLKHHLSLPFPAESKGLKLNHLFCNLCDENQIDPLCPVPWGKAGHYSKKNKKTELLTIKSFFSDLKLLHYDSSCSKELFKTKNFM